MSKATIREYFNAVDNADVDRLLATFHEDVIYERPGYPPIRGIDELRDFYENVRVLASGSHDLEHIIVDGEKGVCWGEFSGKKHDGSEVDVRFADVYTFEDKKIKRRRTFFYAPSV